MPDPKPILLMTRPQAGAVRFLAQLPNLAAFEVITSPLIGITFQPDLPDLSGAAGLIFTSSYGVEAYVRCGGRMDLPCYVVGQTTASVAQRSGLQVKNQFWDAEALVASLPGTSPTAPLRHIRGTHARGDVAARLTAAGITTIETVMYDQPERPLTRPAYDALIGEIPVIAPVFSPRTAALLAKNRTKAPLLVAAMSEAVAKPLLSLHITELRIAAQPESADMVRLVNELAELACAKNFRSGR